MKAVMVMFDSLNRHMLPCYGCDWTHAPNFRRLAERTVTFDHSYVCSMPCMPARRDLLTGRPNFLHRSWGPIEPFDDCVPQMLRAQGTSSHLITDHYHYFEAGGSTYHTQYSTWEFFRGQEGDPWLGLVGDQVERPAEVLGRRGDNEWQRQDWVNRMQMRSEEEQPISGTFRAGLNFLQRNHAQDNWFLQIETFDPHEPFFTHRKWQDLYPHAYDGPHFDWPAYRFVEESPEAVEHCRRQYAALLSQCDSKLGDVLDTFDRLGLWDDTMLIVWTDHGFMLGEQNCWAKCWQPFYEPISHTPFFVWDPRSRRAGERRQALVQPSIDLGPTLLDFFGQQPTADMLGRPLTGTIDHDAAVREAALFGMHGAHVNVTDGRYAYYRAPATAASEPLYNYTLMPTDMRNVWGPQRFAQVELAPPFGFTKGCPTLKTPVAGRWARAHEFGTLLYDLEADPQQAAPLQDAAAEARMVEHLQTLLRQGEAPVEQYQRLGLPA
ncbi:MAG: sulfatase [Fimbriimonadaceae bacterium]|nr:sulfatase [Fimbriimonadaceae bacterium]